MTVPAPRQHTSPGAPELASVLANARTKRISAMVRVRNEEEFLAAAVHSITAWVDEILIVDNASTDGTPEVIRTLAREVPAVRVRSYDHQVARPGRENFDAVRADAGADPRRLSTYYNWALQQCSHPFILKWDGDMVAGPQLGQAIDAWRAGAYISMRFNGLNAHPDRVHLLASRSSDPDVVGRPLTGNRVPGWALNMTYCDPETRLFPRFLARFDDRRFWWCENLDTPLAYFGPGSGEHVRRYCLELALPQYVHLKYWKSSPHSNHSGDLQAMVERNMAVGPRIPDAWREVLAHHRLIA